MPALLRGIAMTFDEQSQELANALGAAMIEYLNHVRRKPGYEQVHVLEALIKRNPGRSGESSYSFQLTHENPGKSGLIIQEFNGRANHP